jgi:hypothetical protein
MKLVPVKTAAAAVEVLAAEAVAEADLAAEAAAVTVVIAAADRADAATRILR